MVIDLFADSVAILNLLDLRRIMGCAGGTRLVFMCAFRAKRESSSLYISREKGDHYYIQTRHNSMYWYSAHSLSKISILN